MTFAIGSIIMTAFGIGWFGYRLLIKRDLREHLDELRIGAFIVAVWALVWWLLFL